MADRLIEEPKALENKIRGRLMSKGNDDPKSSRTGEQQFKKWLKKVTIDQRQPLSW